MKHSFYSQTPPIIIYFKDAKMFRCNYYNLKKTIIRISHGTTPLKKIPSVTQTSLQVGKGSMTMFGPLSRTNITLLRPANYGPNLTYTSIL
jgi:hypothetical protein